MCWLANSPDGLVYDQNDIVELLEIKCPYSAQELTPIDASLKLPNFPCILNNRELKLKKSHKYYYQIQGQLGITKMNRCDFIVYTPLGLNIERISFDSTFCRAILVR